MQAKARGIRGNTGTFGSLTKRFDGKEDKVGTEIKTFTN